MIPGVDGHPMVQTAGNVLTLAVRFAACGAKRRVTMVMAEKNMYN